MKFSSLLCAAVLSSIVLNLVEARGPPCEDDSALDACPSLYEFLSMGPVVTDLDTEQPWLAQGDCNSLKDFLMETPAYDNIVQVLGDIMPASGSTLLLPLPLNNTNDDPPTLETLSFVLPNFIIPNLFEDVDEMLEAGRADSSADTSVIFREQANKVIATFTGLRGASGVIVPLKFEVGKNAVFLMDQSTHYIPSDYSNYTAADAELLPGLNLESDQGCWKASYGRGAGTPITDCGTGEEKNGALCYPSCRSGYVGNGPVCWESCPSGYKDDGAFCRRDADIYGKGCCCTLFGCCNRCPSGYSDDGCTCRKDVHIFAKKSYGRGAGTPLKCKSGLDVSSGLCYKGCRSGYKGEGPVCWAQNAPNGFPVKCNDISWGSSQAACESVNSKLVGAGINVGVGLGACITGYLTKATALCEFGVERLVEAATQGAALAGVPAC